MPNNINSILYSGVAREEFRVLGVYTASLMHILIQTNIIKLIKLIVI